MKYGLKLQLREKILLGFGLVLFIMLIVFAVSLISLLKLGKASEAILKQNYLSIEATYQMLDAIEQHYSILVEASITGSILDYQSYMDEQMRFDKWLLIEKGNITEKGEIESVQDLEKDYRIYLENSYKFVESGPKGNYMSYAWLNENVRPYLLKVRHYNLQIMDINKKVMFKASERAKLIAHKATYTLTLIGFLGVILALILSFSLSSLIVRPLKNMLAAIEKVARGDYSARIEHHSSDELSIVSREFNHMAKKLSEYHEINIRSILKEKQITEAILLNMDDGLFLLDTDYHITNVNCSGARFFDTEPAACTGKHILEIIRYEILFEYIKETAEKGKAPFFSEGQNYLSIGTDVTKRYLQFYLTPISQNPDTLIGVMILLQDITHLKQLDKLKSEFLMIASHELKTPLTSINMSIALLKEKAEAKLNTEENELLQIAVDDTLRLKALISDLLDISKIEAGKIELSIENISVDNIMAKTIHSFQTEAHEKNITLGSEYEPDIKVRGDFGKIAWILTNLVSNATRFTPAGGRIDLKAIQLGKYVQFSVTDNGIGIPYEFQNKIFDKFFQVASPFNTGGTGLGLAICKEIVRAHGGTIWVESEPDKGSTFYFTLPTG